MMEKVIKFIMQFNNYKNKKNQQINTPLLEGHQQQMLAIPTEYCGAVIGKNGINISNIKEQSNTTIAIADQLSNSNERIATITGTPQGIQIAIHLIRDIIQQENEKKQEQQVDVDENGAEAAEVEVDASANNNGTLYSQF